MTRKNKKILEDKEEQPNVVTKKIKKQRKLSKNEIEDLCNAIKFGDDKEAKRIINIMEDINNSITDNRDTALTYCCVFGRINVVKILIELGADVNKTDIIGNSPLLNAVNNGNFEMVQVLIDSGADVNYTRGKFESALSLAVSKNKNEIFELLITSGVEIEEKGGDVLIKACSNGNLTIIKRLLELGVNINHSQLNGYTSLHYACVYDNLNIVEFLMNNGADENIKSNAGHKPIEYATNEKIKEYLTNYNSTKFVLK